VGANLLLEGVVLSMDRVYRNRPRKRNQYADLFLMFTVYFPRREAAPGTPAPQPRPCAFVPGIFSCVMTQSLIRE
jgi:hypothetical protein